MTNQQSNPDGTLGDDEQRWLSMRARGGFGMVMTCAAHVAPEGQAFPGQLGIWDDHTITGLKRIATDIGAAGGVSIAQLHHGGRRGLAGLTGLTPVAPIRDRESGARALTTEEVEQVVETYAAAARRAQLAGFDGVEIHGAHSFLISQFLDVRNDRRDRFGGPLANRAKFLFDVLDRVRSETRPSFQVGLRLDPERDGVPLAEAVTVAGEVLTSGLIDFLDLSMKDTFKHPHEADHANRPLLEYFTALPRGDTRLGVAGRIASGPDAQLCLDLGADFVLIGSAAIIHHDFARRVLADPSFEANPKPVTIEYLQREGVSKKFADYLATGWTDFVTA